MISGAVFGTIERILTENNIPIPPGHGREKLEKIARLVETTEMPEDAKERIRNLLRTA